MAKEIFLYNDFYRFTAEDFARQINESMSEDVVVRLYSAGGDPRAGYTMLAKMQEHGKISIKVDGYADSMAFYMLCYANGVEALNTSSFTIHRAMYHDESNMTSDTRKELDRINGFLRKGLEAKVSPEKFFAVTGVSMDEIFSMDSRIDVQISAEQAKELGIVETITSVTEVMVQAISKRMAMAASTLAKRLDEQPVVTSKERETTAIKTEQTKNQNKMNAEKLRSEHPELYKEILALGAEQEKDRVGAWMAFVDVDPEAVAKGVKDGAIISQTAMAEFSRKAMSAEALKAIKGDSTTVEDTADDPKIKAETEKEKEAEAFLAKSRESRDPRFNVKTEEK